MRSIDNKLTRTDLQADYKQLLDEVFVISGIINIQYTIYIVLKKITTNALSQDIAVRALDIALGNHALRAQPTDYSLICRYRLVNNL